MLPKTLFQLTKNLATVLGELEASGMRIEIGDDFSEYCAYRRQQTERGPVYPMFNVANSYIDHTNGFWICGFDAENALIHTQAVRLLDLTGLTLGAHLNIHRHKYITPDTTPDPDVTFFEGPDALEKITGKVCYQGEFWLHGRGLGGPRSQGATSLLSRVLLEVAAAAWEPDFVFALVPKKLAAKGAHLRYGYWHCEPGHWVGPDQQVTDEDHLIWMGAKDMMNMLSRSPQGAQKNAKGPKIAVPSPPVLANGKLG